MNNIHKTILASFMLAATSTPVSSDQLSVINQSARVEYIECLFGQVDAAQDATGEPIYFKSREAWEFFLKKLAPHCSKERNRYARTLVWSTLGEDADKTQDMERISMMTEDAVISDITTELLR